ncbi:MAG: O-antigen ligase family protein [Elusimicrobia bacterium]|nr:O-antigen ligase family protein [Elusimicrobiota bacterium]
MVNLYKGAAFEQTLFYLSFFFVLLFLLSHPGGLAWDKISKALFVLSLCLACLAIVEHCFDGFADLLKQLFHPMTHESLRRQSMVSFQNPGTFGAFMVIGYILGLTVTRNIPTGLFLLLEIIFITAVVFSQSRIALAMISFIFTIHSYIRLKKFRWGRLVFALIMCSGLFLVSRMPRIKWMHTIMSLPVEFNYRVNLALTGRVSIWTGSLKVWSDHKVLGVGPGNSKHFLPSYLPYWLNDRQQHPHNLFLRVLCETGLIGLAAFLIFALHLFKPLSRRFLNMEFWPLWAFLFFQMFEEHTRDAFPALLLVLLTARAVQKESEIQQCAA